MRLKFLDGLRGWGAVIVLLYHVFTDSLPADTNFAEKLKLFLPFNGVMAVFVFFVVSGFSLSVRYLADGDIRRWLKIAAGRYLRLAIPIFAACLLVHIVMVCGLVDPPGERLVNFRRFFNFDPTVGHLLNFSLFDVFFHYSSLDTYIGPLWTMSPELFGSFIVLVAVVICRPLPFRSLFLLALAGLIVWLAPTDSTVAVLALFPVGAAMADWFNRGWLDAVPKPVGFMLLLIGCLVPVLLPAGVANWGLIGTSSLTLGCIAVARTRNWLSGPVSAHLGKISFPLYLMHGPVICFVGEPLMRHFGHGLGLKVLIELAVVVLSFAAAYAFWPVNEFAINVARRFAELVTNPFFVSQVHAKL